MRRRLLEQTTLFFSIVKWTLLASLVGVVGVATAGFLKSLDFSIAWTQRLPYWYALLPVGGLACGWLITTFAPQAEGHGTEQVIAAVHEQHGRIPFKVMPVKWLATLCTIATGGSAGKEGPCAQIGGGLASALASVLRVRPEERRKLVICGISAGFASVFGTPIAGALFGIEVLFLGQMLYDVLYPSFVAGIISYQVSRMLGISYFHHAISVVPVFTEIRFLKVIGLGICCGLGSLLLIEGMKFAHRVFARLRVAKRVKPALGGLLLLCLVPLSSTAYLGLGLPMLEAAINGQTLAPSAWPWKILFTSITLGSGGSGGVITPIFFIGAALGNALSGLLHMQPAVVAALGMVAMLSGAANTPIAASIMAIEFFGPAIGPDAAVACIVAFLFSGHRSVYHSQRLGITKSEALKMPLQEIVGKIEGVELSEEASALLQRIQQLTRRWKPRR
jgi:H+/Cl- antiporter ClcA